MSAYREFAALYDELMDDIPYDEWAKRYERLIGLRPGMRVAEMGCGTGAFPCGWRGTAQSSSPPTCRRR